MQYTIPEINNGIAKLCSGQTELGRSLNWLAT